MGAEYEYAAGPEAADGATGPTGCAGGKCKSFPQLLQYLAFDRWGLPQCGQFCMLAVIATPQLGQNLAFGRSCALHLGQSMIPVPVLTIQVLIPARYPPVSG
jgi:hypothetical protein